MTPAERYHFDLYGYIVRRQALTMGEVATLRSAVDALGLPPPGPTIPSQRFRDHLLADPAFRALVDHPAVFDVLVEAVGEYLRLDHAYGIRMAPGTSGLGLHGGGSPWDPAQYYVWRDGRMFNGLTAVQWALCDAGPGDGGFCCVPGSHKANLPLPAGTEPTDALVVEVPLAAGDVVVFTEALTHGTLPWRARHERLTLLYKYSPGHASWAEHYPGVDDLLELLTPRQRWLVEDPAVAYRRTVGDFE